MRMRPYLPTLIVLVLVAFALLVLDLNARSLWVDELFTARVASLPLGELVREVEADIHPPLYFLAVRGWVAVLGTSEFALRWQAVCAALLGLCLTWKLGVWVANPRSATVGAVALAVFPLFVQFSRMARYYSTVLALGVLATLLLLVACRHDRPRQWVAYTVASLLTLYTAYIGALLLVAHGVALLLMRGITGAQRLKWVGSMVVLGVLSLLWRGLTLAGQVERASSFISADFSGSLSGLILALGYPFYAFSVGETLFPWFSLALPTLALVLGLVGWGLWRLPATARVLVGLSIGIPILLGAPLVVYLSVGTPFLNLPPRIFFVLPFVMLALGAGWTGVRDTRWRVRMAILIGITWSVGLTNYYQGLHFLNPNYIIPAREAAQMIAAQARADDMVIGEWDSGFTYYYDHPGRPAPYFEATAEADILAYLSSHDVDEVWLVTIGRDRTRETTPTDLIGWLQDNYTLVDEEGFVEQDPVYRQAKERLLRRPAYQYKLLIRRYERPSS